MYLLELDGDFRAAGTPEPLGPGFGPVWSPDDTRIVYDTRAGVCVKTLVGSQPDLPVGGQWLPGLEAGPASVNAEEPDELKDGGSPAWAGA